VKGTTKYFSKQYIDFPIRTGINPDIVSQFPPSDYYIDVGATPEENNSNDYYFASWQLSALNNRLKFNAAMNRTNIKLVQHSAKPNITKVSKNSPMFGAMYDVTKGVSVFAVHSTSLFPTSDKNDFDAQMPPVTGKSYEGGVKVELLGGKISGTLSYYEITQKGGSQRDPSADNRNKLLWDSMTPEQRTAQFGAGTTRADLRDRGGNLGDLVAGGTATSKGFEADIVFQPTPNWQAMISYAHNNQEVTKAVNSATVGQSTSGHIKDQFSALTKYTFTDGPVNGLSIGLGLQSAGKALQDYSAPGGTARYNPSTFYLETFASYKFKAFGYQQRVQLNLKNLTQQDSYVGWYAKSGDTYAMSRYKVPGKMIWNLSYALEF
jgi:outer membrane receptor for ferric coprogen and ferric-rhodotorulic acid